MGYFRSGINYRYPSDRDIDKEYVDGLTNFFWVTRAPGKPLPLLERGISQIAPSKVGARPVGPYPAILISSTPHTRGSEWNPWHDVFEPDLGYIRYFGDAKKPGDPSAAPGNKVLLEELKKHTSGDRETRELAAPLVFFERVSVDGRAYGNIKFHGFGVIEKAELVTQYNPGIGYFTNFVFTFAVLSLSDEQEQLAWNWINSRRDPSISIAESNRQAPVSWQMFLRHGTQKIEAYRRRAALAKVEAPSAQMPVKNSREETALKQIYEFYTGVGKHRFELLASRVVMSFINSNGGSYSEGWVTRGSGDGGVDFVGKVRVGIGFAGVDVVVLGQAKCEALDKPTNGVAIARTVARLKRGWIGAYVTTSYFSKASQLEILDDSYPLIKIGGLTLAEEALKLVDSGGFRDLSGLLESLELEYPEMIQNRRPEEILDVQPVRKLSHG
jgi:hypothetical protein